MAMMSRSTTGAMRLVVAIVCSVVPKLSHNSFQVTVENFVRLLTNRFPSSTPRSKKLLTDPGSNILIYLTGTKNHF